MRDSIDPVSQKNSHFILAEKFGKCWPIFKILALSDSVVIIQQIDKDPLTLKSTQPRMRQCTSIARTRTFSVTVWMRQRRCSLGLDDVKKTVSDYWASNHVPLAPYRGRGITPFHFL